MYLFFGYDYKGVRGSNQVGNNIIIMANDLQSSQ